MNVCQCYWVARRILSLDRALGVLAHDLGDVAHNGRKHTRLLGSTRESSTVLVLEAPNVSVCKYIRIDGRCS